MSWSRAIANVLMLVALAVPAAAQDVRLQRPNINVIEITNGTWRLQYGSSPQMQARPQMVTVPGDRAWFSHGSWLRRIDTRNGLVLGRWRFPGFIETVTDAGNGAADVRFALSPLHTTPSMTVRFDPNAGNAPLWDSGSLLAYRASEWETVFLARVMAPFADWPNGAPNAAAALPAFEEMAARDSYSPFFRLMRAVLLRESGDPRADAAFEDIFAARSDDFTEWFRLATIFDRLPTPEPALAARAFDRGFTDFIRRGRDPRLVDTLIARLVVFPLGNLAQANPEFRETALERIYQIGPTSEATERGWEIHARALEAAGDTAGAARWRARAETSAHESLYIASIAFQLRHDRGLLLGLAAIIASVIMILTRRVKYAAQLRMRRDAIARSGQHQQRVFGGIAYWTRRERWSLLLLIVVGWLALGYSRVYSRAIQTAFAMPIHVGQVAGPENFARYPASDERTLMQAFSQQATGNAAEAERLYRSVPQFAESWNNIGVLRARAGDEAGSREAFARAIALDAALPEAIFNAEGRATTELTQTFAKYAAPEMKMTALPSRDRLLAAYLGSLWTHRYAATLLGPSEVLRADTRSSTFLNNRLLIPAVAGGAVLLVLLVVLVAALMFVRRQDATVPPGRMSTIVEFVIPGLSGAWQWGSAPILLLWCTAVLAAGLQLVFSSPYLLTAAAQPGIMRAFGYAVGYQDLNPPLTLLFGVAAALWIANAIILRRRAPTSP